jgi:hypothetical protein
MTSIKDYTMLPKLNAVVLLVLFVTSFDVYSGPVLTNDSVLSLSKEYSVKASLLSDFIESYNFKCPDEISEPQLSSLLKDRYADNQLNIMIESENLNWRDIYVGARSDIVCLTEGSVSKGY